MPFQIQYDINLQRGYNGSLAEGAGPFQVRPGSCSGSCFAGRNPRTGRFGLLGLGQQWSCVNHGPESAGRCLWDRDLLSWRPRRYCLLRFQAGQIRPPMSSTPTARSCRSSSWERSGCLLAMRWNTAFKSCRPQPTETGLLDQTRSLPTSTLWSELR